MNDQAQLELASGSWDDFGAGNPRTIGEAIGAIRRTALTESEKGTRFETDAMHDLRARLAREPTVGGR